MAERNGIKVFVSSTVYDFETQLTEVFAILDTMGYDVFMSKKGTIPIDSTLNAFTNCVEGVEQCDVFLGFIRPLLGTGIYKGEEKSVTEQEIDAAMVCGMPRFMVADYRVEYAHQFLNMMKLDVDSIPAVFEKEEIIDGVTKIIQKPNKVIHPHAIRMYRKAIVNGIKPERDRIGNWVQPFQKVSEYREFSDISVFVEAQFRDVERIRSLIAKCKGL